MKNWKNSLNFESKKKILFFFLSMVSLLNYAAIGAGLANYYGIPIGNLENNLGGVIGKGLETALGSLLGLIGGTFLDKEGFKNIGKLDFQIALHFGLVATLADFMIPNNQIIQTLLVVIVPMVILKKTNQDKMSLME